MKLLVCISRTPETTAKVSFNEAADAFKTEGVNYIMNPYDEWYGLVRAVELAEASGGKVTAINVGTSANDIIIRKALAIGAADAVRVDAEPQSAFFVAKQISEYAKDKDFDIIFLGKETIDYNGSEVGAMIAEMLDLPYVSYATNLERTGNTNTVTRDIEGGEEVAEIEGSVVISAAKGLAEQRIPNMRGIMMAKRKPLEVIPAVGSEELVKAVHFQVMPGKSGVKMVDPEDMDELVRLLHEEAKII